jgi:Flp pilus assembly pilin Flp
MKLVKAFAANESGAAPIEYILIAVGIVLVAATALDVITFVTSGLSGSSIANLMGH